MTRPPFVVSVRQSRAVAVVRAGQVVRTGQVRSLDRAVNGAVILSVAIGI